MNEFGHYCLCLAWALSLFVTVLGIVRRDAPVAPLLKRAELAWRWAKMAAGAGVVFLAFFLVSSPDLSNPWLLPIYQIAGICVAVGFCHLVQVHLPEAWFQTMRRATLLVGLCVALSIGCLAQLFLTHDYTNQYVWQFSNRDMPSIYKVTAIWGGMDGSMLLWCFFLTLNGSLVALFSNVYPRRLAPWALTFINSSSLFFLTITLFFTNPFRYIKAPFIPPDGNGLNPLLQNEYMAIHPPLLYLGFTGFAVPYAFCMAALASKSLGNDWIQLTRRWSLIAWSFLTAGIVLGGHWAYIELGWGGFWAWDPVENASFLPWLTGTAYLHSVMVQERKGMLKTWNVSLVVLTYALTVFGTFLTRSGIVQSVHAFASTDVGWVFLLYLDIVVTTAICLIVIRRPLLNSERKIESFWSREAFFLINNLVLLSICFAVLWGVLFPVFSEALTGTKQTVGIPFFNTVNVPLFLLLLLAMAIGPVIAWRRSSLLNLGRLFVVPVGTALVVALILLWAGISGFYPILSYSICWLVVMTVGGELHRSARSQGGEGISQNYGRLAKRHRAKVGGHIVHLGVALATLSITASMAHKTEQELSLSQGQSRDIGRFTLTLDEFHPLNTPNYEGVTARVTARSRNDGAVTAVLHPEMRFYRKNQETTTEVALSMSARDDLYVVLAGLDNSGTRATFKVFINPLQVWLWFGAIIMVIGGIFIVIPDHLFVRQSVPEDVKGEERITV